MRRDEGWARQRFATTRVARLATVTPDGRPHLVPITFALLDDGDALVSAVDAKPKSTTALRRLDNIAAHPAVALIVDEYSEQWDELWWARLDGVAEVHRDWPGARDALVARYPQYQTARPDGPLIVVRAQRWTGWSASGD